METNYDLTPFSFFSYFSSFLNGSRNVLTDAQKRELFYDSPLNFAETLLSTTTLFRKIHTHTCSTFFSFHKEEGFEGRGQKRSNVQQQSLAAHARKHSKTHKLGHSEKKTPKQPAGDLASLLQLLKGAFGVLSAPFRIFFAKVTAGGSLCTCLFRRATLLFSLFFPSKCIRETPFFYGRGRQPTRLQYVVALFLRHHLMVMELLLLWHREKGDAAQKHISLLTLTLISFVWTLEPKKHSLLDIETPPSVLPLQAPGND